MILVTGKTDERMINFFDDCVCVIKTVDRHCRTCAELDGELDAFRLYDRKHGFDYFNCILADLRTGCRNIQIHGRNNNDHLAAENLAAADDLTQLVENRILLFLCLLHIEENKCIVRRHFQMMRFKELTDFLNCNNALLQVSVQALGLDIDQVETVLVAQLQIFHNGMSCTALAVRFVKS